MNHEIREIRDISDNPLVEDVVRKRNPSRKKKKNFDEELEKRKKKKPGDTEKHQDKDRARWQRNLPEGKKKDDKKRKKEGVVDIKI